jgi:guanylate kinase
LPSSTDSATPTPKPVFVVTGPSGAGKGTLIQLVLPRFPELRLAVSATTRRQRPGEQDGVHYWFLDRPEFDRRIEAGEFLEWVDYVGNRYGTLHSEIDRLRREGHAPLLELETEGALRVQRRVENAHTIFVTAREQLAQSRDFDFSVENDDRERAADALAAIIDGQLRKTATMARP